MNNGHGFPCASLAPAPSAVILRLCALRYVNLPLTTLERFWPCIPSPISGPHVFAAHDPCMTKVLSFVCHPHHGLRGAGFPWFVLRPSLIVFFSALPAFFLYPGFPRFIGLWLYHPHLFLRICCLLIVRTYHRWLFVFALKSSTRDMQIERLAQVCLTCVDPVELGNVRSPTRT